MFPLRWINDHHTYKRRDKKREHYLSCKELIFKCHTHTSLGPALSYDLFQRLLAANSNSPAGRNHPLNNLSPPHGTTTFYSAPASSSLLLHKPHDRRGMAYSKCTLSTIKAKVSTGFKTLTPVFVPDPDVPDQRHCGAQVKVQL